MKIIERSILPFQENVFFSPLREKLDYARVIMYAARYLLVDYDFEGLEISGTFKILIDKMNRLFIYKNTKFFSISFPFSILTDGDTIIEITTYSGKIIDNKSISMVLSILENPLFKLNPSPIDFFIDSGSVESIGFSILEEVFQFEPSYIRYDIDAKHENGKMHPLYHLDINYSPYGTFKLGLSSSINQDYFRNLLDTTTDCLFLSE